MAAETLIVYYSWSGNSEKLAKNLHQAIIGSDLFKIVTKRKYSASFFLAAFQAGREKRKHARPEIEGGIAGKKCPNMKGSYLSTLYGTVPALCAC